jgi:PPOX class probable F420-dependent enzyme
MSYKPGYSVIIRGMANLSDDGVQALLSNPNHAVLSTLNEDGTIHSSVVWVDTDGDAVAVNSAKGRKWPTNLERDPRTTLVVLDEKNPYEYVELRGSAEETAEGAEEHIDALAKKYIGQDKYPWRVEGEDRVKFRIRPQRVRYAKAG